MFTQGASEKKLEVGSCLYCITVHTHVCTYACMLTQGASEKKLEVGKLPEGGKCLYRITVRTHICTYACMHTHRGRAERSSKWARFLRAASACTASLCIPPVGVWSISREKKQLYKLQPLCFHCAAFFLGAAFFCYAILHVALLTLHK